MNQPEFTKLDAMAAALQEAGYTISPGRIVYPNGMWKETRVITNPTDKATGSYQLDAHSVAPELVALRPQIKVVPEFQNAVITILNALPYLIILSQVAEHGDFE